MNKRSFLALVALVFSFIMMSVSLAGPGGGRSGDNSNDDDSSTISTEEVQSLLFMREEEKLARDVYLTLYVQWGNDVFNNIAESEQRHMDTMLELIEKYNLTDPALEGIGLFTDSELQALYSTLVSREMTSELEGLYTGALIEEVDMEDIQHAIEEAHLEDIVSTYESLLCGSRNHLRAFVGQIESRGIVYQAQVLSQEEVDAIINSPIERDCGH